MNYDYFEVENFKGVEHIRIDLTRSPKANVYALVGLNESGKTTILEAINFFHQKRETLESLNLIGYRIDDIHNLIPISKRSNFNDSIRLTVGISIDQEDKDKISEFCLSNLSLRIADLPDRLVIREIYPFKNSRYLPENREYSWIIELKGIPKRGRVVRNLTQTEWEEVTNYMQSMIPGILYFPNFLFDFPEKIYLEDINIEPSKREKQRFYQLLIQDILDALDNNTNIETHIVERARSSAKEDEKSLQDLLLQMSRNVSKSVFDAWNSIFNRKFTDKSIRISCDIDDSGVYLQFRLEDSDGNYLINERSLGFRWFFVFLLLTQYRGSRKNAPKNTLFLFDEPASNLHSTAQSELLRSLHKLGSNCKVIYTTHSQYLINPEWLENTFVVVNRGLQYEKDDEYSANRTDIKIYPYRDFAVKHPDQSNYYKPILDVLDYAPSRIEFVPNVVMVEGKNDFYNINYILNIIIGRQYCFKLMPGMGSSHLDNLIRLYIAWGRQFIILLDSDKEGSCQADRYRNEFGVIVDDRVFTLLDINKTWANFTTEDLFTPEDRIKIQKSCYSSSDDYDKKYFHRAVQELFMRKTLIDLSQKCIDNFTELFDFLDEKMKRLIHPSLDQTGITSAG